MPSSTLFLIDYFPFNRSLLNSIRLAMFFAKNFFKTAAKTGHLHWEMFFGKNALGSLTQLHQPCWPWPNWVM
jgi:hypothetical protein